MEETLEKILRQSQLTGLIARVECKDISFKDMKEILHEYQCWSEQIWEKYYQETKFNTFQSLEILKQRQVIFELKNEVEKLNKLINANI